MPKKSKVIAQAVKRFKGIPNAVVSKTTAQKVNGIGDETQIHVSTEHVNEVNCSRVREIASHFSLKQLPSQAANEHLFVL